MVSPVAVARSAACCGCRKLLLRSFLVSVAGPQVVPPLAFTPPSRRRQYSVQNPRRIASKEHFEGPEDDEFPLNDINRSFARLKDESNKVAKDAEQRHDGGEEHISAADYTSGGSGAKVQTAMERLGVADTWEEVVSLWLEGRAEQADQLHSLLKQKLQPRRKKVMDGDAKIILRALRGDAGEAIQRLEEISDLGLSQRQQLAPQSDLKFDDELPTDTERQVSEDLSPPGIDGNGLGVDGSGSVGGLHEEAGSSIEREPSNTTALEEESNEPTPWYLQPQHQPSLQQQPSRLAMRQSLPPLPTCPPPLLQPLLNYISVDMGMDDLSILDLRTLFPPPALGSNLLMIVGTARSEKHLHVSSDRLCRWLRTAHHLTPTTDGLLGRAEFKLKMRRAMKKARITAGVGTKDPVDAQLEDGIRTGWVCVNVGRVEGGDLPEGDTVGQEEAGFVGFRDHSPGSRIVVQLMTEEKRGEVDLERLWTGVLRRSARENGTPGPWDDAYESADDPWSADHAGLNRRNIE